MASEGVVDARRLTDARRALNPTASRMDGKRRADDHGEPTVDSLRVGHVQAYSRKPGGPSEYRWSQHDARPACDEVQLGSTAAA